MLVSRGQKTASLFEALASTACTASTAIASCLCVYRTDDCAASEWEKQENTEKVREPLLPPTGLSVAQMSPKNNMHTVRS